MRSLSSIVLYTEMDAECDKLVRVACTTCVTRVDVTQVAAVVDGPARRAVSLALSTEVNAQYSKLAGVV